MRRTLTLAMGLAMAMTTAACDEDRSGLGDVRDEIDYDAEQDELDHDAAQELAAPAAAQAVVTNPQVTVVAWSDGNDIRSTAYCTDYVLDANPTRCTCDGLVGLGHTGYDDDGVDIKCKMCTDGGGWPCALTPDGGGTEVELTFVDNDGHALYSYVDEADQVAPVDPPWGSTWVLSCYEPLASCNHTCDPGGQPCTCGEDYLEFAVTRPYWQDGVRHITAEGGFHIGLAAGTCD